MGRRLIARNLALAAVALAVMAQSGGGLFEQDQAPVINYRAAEDRSLDLMVDYQAVVGSEAPAGTGETQSGADPDPILTGDDRAAREPPPRLDLSRPLQEGWQMDPVLLNRRQAGEPLRPGDDETDQTFGIQLRKEF